MQLPWPGAHDFTYLVQPMPQQLALERESLSQSDCYRRMFVQKARDVGHAPLELHMHGSISLSILKFSPGGLAHTNLNAPVPIPCQFTKSFHELGGLDLHSPTGIALSKFVSISRALKRHV